MALLLSGQYFCEIHQKPGRRLSLGNADVFILENEVEDLLSGIDELAPKYISALRVTSLNRNLTDASFLDIANWHNYSSLSTKCYIFF